MNQEIGKGLRMQREEEFKVVVKNIRNAINLLYNKSIECTFIERLHTNKHLTKKINNKIKSKNNVILSNENLLTLKIGKVV